MRFNDARLSPLVAYARHAISIDEDRSTFPRVRWGTVGDPNRIDEKGIQHLEQVWFAGNHSNIGGSYPENDSRLSDISLKWMVDAATSVGLKVDNHYLNLNPDPLGPQHDERRSILFKYSEATPRNINPNASLHPSVFLRLEASEVLQYDTFKRYRPPSLRDHSVAKKFYE
jgi:hypothetical protein